MKMRWSSREHTYVLTYGKRGIVMGITKRDRPSLYWHWLVKVWLPLCDRWEAKR